MGSVARWRVHRSSSSIVPATSFDAISAVLTSRVRLLLLTRGLDTWNKRIRAMSRHLSITAPYHFHYIA